MDTCSSRALDWVISLIGNLELAMTVGVISTIASAHGCSVSEGDKILTRLFSNTNIPNILSIPH